MKSFFNRKSGFSLIEMIGVIAVIGILAAIATPKVFKVINDSKVTRFAGEISSYTTAATNWYKDIGTLNSLNAAGVIVANDATFQDELIASQGTAALWVDWDGPYIDSVTNNAIGTTLVFYSYNGLAGTAAPTATSVQSFDLNDDNANDMAGKQVVSIRVTGVSASDVIRIDSILDKGLTVANRATSGRVKYSGTTLYIYIASS